jgi:tripartite-type tricarboxylate transporter receptor subunit TctC
MPQIEPGAIRPVVQMGNARLRALPEVATIAESGYPGAQARSWWGFYAPAGTPKPVIERFRAALVESLRDERVAKQLTETQQMTLVLSSPGELRTFAAEQARIWGAVVRDNNIRADE